jgi:cyclopropane-fatty-acyl-phospholipid synthase
LSSNQYEYVNRLIETKGLQGRVRMLLMDYRDIDESRPLDKAGSVGMCEHVGRPNLLRYFAKIHRVLKPGGLLLNHCITAGGAGHAPLDGGMGDFIEKHIFPGGQLVHVGAMLDAMTRANLEPVDAECLRPHYALTLWHWADALESSLGEARRVLGPNAERTLRAYRLYLAGSAMGFERGWTSLFQVLASRPDGIVEAPEQWPIGLSATQSEYPFNRTYMCRDDSPRLPVSGKRQELADSGEEQHEPANSAA